MARTQTASQTGAGSTRWFKVTPHVTPFQVSVQVGVFGTISARVEVTLDEPDAVTGQLPQLLGPGAPPAAAVALTAPGTVALTVDGLLSITTPVTAIRVTVDSGTGTANVRVLQAGLV